MKPITSKMLMRSVWEGMPQAVFIYPFMWDMCGDPPYVRGSRAHATRRYFIGNEHS